LVFGHFRHFRHEFFQYSPYMKMVILCGGFFYYMAIFPDSAFFCVKTAIFWKKKRCSNWSTGDGLIYFFLKLMFSRYAAYLWRIEVDMQSRQVESYRKFRNFRQVSKKKKLSELKLSELSLFFRSYVSYDYAHIIIRVGDPAQSRNFQKNKTGIAAHKVWSNPFRTAKYTPTWGYILKMQNIE
jgi:hypothetical protein